MIEPDNPELSIAAQCRLLSISQAGLGRWFTYYVRHRAHSAPVGKTQERHMKKSAHHLIGLMPP